MIHSSSFIHIVIQGDMHMQTVHYHSNQICRGLIRKHTYPFLVSPSPLQSHHHPAGTLVSSHHPSYILADPPPATAFYSACKFLCGRHTTRAACSHGHRREVADGYCTDTYSHRGSQTCKIECTVLLVVVGERHSSMFVALDQMPLLLTLPSLPNACLVSISFPHCILDNLSSII